MTKQQFVFHSLCLFVFLIIKSAEANVRGGTTKCENATVPMCQGVTGHNTTSFPNRLNHWNQKEAALEVHQFWPLVQINCSPLLAFFLCAEYVPVCESTYGQRLLPCRSVCKRARKGCNKVMTEHGFAWPRKLRCSQYPRNVCLSPKYPSMLKNKTQTKFERKLIRLRTLNLQKVNQKATKNSTKGS